MILFLFLALPFSFYIYNKLTYGRVCSVNLLLYFAGLFISALFCMWKNFFSVPYYLPAADFMSNFIYLFSGYAAIPCFALMIATWFLGRKFPFGQRVDVFHALASGFYSVYLVYRVMVSDLPYPFFYLFAKPVFFSIFISFIPVLIKNIFCTEFELKRIVSSSFMLLFVFVVPFAAEAYWMIGGRQLLVIMIFCLYMLYPVFCFLKGFSFGKA